jgi:hypothetical protein
MSPPSQGHKWDNEDVKIMLLNIRRMVVTPYPFPTDSKVNDQYCMALGLIAGICTEALQSVKDRRPANFDKFIPP